MTRDMTELESKVWAAVYAAEWVRRSNSIGVSPSMHGNHAMRAADLADMAVEALAIQLTKESP